MQYSSVVVLPLQPLLSDSDTDATWLESNSDTRGFGYNELLKVEKLPTILCLPATVLASNNTKAKRYEKMNCWGWLCINKSYTLLFECAFGFAIHIFSLQLDF